MIHRLSRYVIGVAKSTRQCISQIAVVAVGRLPTDICIYQRVFWSITRTALRIMLEMFVSYFV
jgi:hypothetical protein